MPCKSPKRPRYRAGVFRIAVAFDPDDERRLPEIEPWKTISSIVCVKSEAVATATTHVPVQAIRFERAKCSTKECEACGGLGEVYMDGSEVYLDESETLL